ncbi:uncharacterized protein LOC134773083 [Penaeus indicus]|uniref:uncharacterized protein LOC134773083 n=1 Tax=Penaeus indicus TaxID=29960 RepID=UPI00300C4577
MSLHQGLVESIEEVCPEKPPVSITWIDEECWRLIQERTGAKQRGMNSDEHRQATKIAQGDYKTVYKNIKRVYGKKISKPGIGRACTGGDRGEEEPLVLEAEIETTIKKAKKGKVVGIYEVPAEDLKAGRETVVKAMKSITDKIWRTGELAHYLVPQIAVEQFGFTAGKGTTEAILVLRNIIQKVAKKQEADQVWFLFVDYSKAFDSVYHDALWKTLLDFGVPSHLTWLLKGLYDRGKGKIMREVLERVQDQQEEPPRKSLGGRKIWNVRYADDATMLTRSRKECGVLGEVLAEVSEEVGLNINRAKTTAINVHGDGDIQIGGETIETVRKMKFLGSQVTQEDDSTADIKNRIGLAKSVTIELAETWKSSVLSRGLKVKLAKALVWSVALYACETWTVRKQEERMIDAFEMWLWRRVIRVKWTERRTNEWVREQVGVREEQGIMQEIKRRKIQKYGHWKRRGESLVLATIEGETEGVGRRGRRRIEWVSNIFNWQRGLEEAHMHAHERRPIVCSGAARSHFVLAASLPAEAFYCPVTNV